MTRRPGHTDCTEKSSAPESEAEVGGTTVLSSVGPDRDPAGTGGCLVAGVRAAQEAAVGSELLASLRAHVRAEVGSQGGQVGPVVRRAEGDDPPGEVTAVVVGQPHPHGDPAGRVAHEVHRVGAAGRQRRADRLVEDRRLGMQVVGAGAAELDDPSGPAGAAQRLRKHGEAGRRPAVPRHEEHGGLGVLCDRSDARSAVGQGEHDDGGGRQREGRSDSQHEPAAGRGERGEHAPILPRGVKPDRTPMRPACRARRGRARRAPSRRRRGWPAGPGARSTDRDRPTGLRS